MSALCLFIVRPRGPLRRAVTRFSAYSEVISYSCGYSLQMMDVDESKYHYLWQRWCGGGWRAESPMQKSGEFLTGSDPF